MEALQATVRGNIFILRKREAPGKSMHTSLRLLYGEQEWKRETSKEATVVH